MSQSIRNPRSHLKTIISGSIVFAGLLFIGLLIVFINLHPPSNDQFVFSSPYMTIIPAPTLTPVSVVPTTTLSGATSTANLPIQPGGIAVGKYVKITGTNGDGLNLRTAPGTNSTARFIGMDSEVFLVKDGPQQVDNIIWWFLQAPYDASRNGWAAASYLSLVQTP
jgi:hypothetical protein